MNIRPATAEDATAITRLGTSFSPEARSTSSALSHFTHLLQTDGHRVWVAEMDGAIAGWLHAFAALRVGVPPFIEIGGLVVKPDCRRAKIGSGLVQKATAWAEAEGMKLRVRCNSEREPSHRFYEALGFELLKQQHVFER
ncbi:GNAT family N-acetyltransferase [Marinobacter santoriniensis]|uniref:GNAT family N-acetyltransferase n=1 Tax=Marinobacter santoriniensis TaxID=523742 RepID=UPI0009FBA134|nr:GNAT family N-acetyltransferase [Marinobacter santoriniensis]